MTVIDLHPLNKGHARRQIKMSAFSNILRLNSGGEYGVRQQILTYADYCIPKQRVKV